MKPTAPPVVGVAGFECGESLTPDSSLSAFLHAFGKIAAESRPPDGAAIRETSFGADKKSALTAARSETSFPPSEAPLVSNDGGDSSTAAFLRALGGLTGGSSLLEIPPPAPFPETAEAAASSEPPPPLPASLSTPLASSENAAFMRALEDAVGGSPLGIALAQPAVERSTTSASRLPPPIEVADELLARLRATGALEDES